MRSVSVIGIGETKMGKFPDKSLRDLILEAGTKALKDSKINKDKIEALFIGNFNASQLVNQSHINAMASEVLGLKNIPTIRTEGACASGSLAFRQAFIAVTSGIYDIVLVGGVEKMTHQTTETVTSAIASAADVEQEVNLGTTFPSIFAMIANRYMYEYGDVRNAMSTCAVQNHNNARLNSNAQIHKKIDIEDVKLGIPISEPFTIYDCSLVTDGAAFVVLAATEVADKLIDNPLIEVIGSGHAGDTLTLSSKPSMTTLNATIYAANEAYKMAEVNPTDIDFAEVHDCFTITQIINIEDLGFFEKGKGARAVLEGKTALKGSLPINTSGGLKAKGHPIGATGISQIYEVITQLRGDAGERQVKDAGVGLTHNLGGTGATCLVHIFKRR